MAAPIFELKLPAAASPGQYRFLSMSGNEALGRLFEFHVRFSSDKPSIDPTKILGQKVRLSIETKDGRRHFHGYATAIEYHGPIDLPLPADGKNTAQFQYVVVLHPWLWFLTRTSDCRVFAPMKVPKMLDEIFGKYAGTVENKLSGDYQTWEFCVQYRETDFNFVSRLAEQEGIFYFFQHEEEDHKLTLVDLYGPGLKAKHTIPYAAGERTGRPEEETVHSWTMQHEVQPGAYAMHDFDFKKPASPQKTVVKKPFAHAQGALEIFDYPGEFDSTGEGDAYVRIRLEELGAQYETIHGVCNVRALAAGDVFELANAEQAGAAAKAKYLVTEATYDMSSGLEFSGQGVHYACSFACIRSETQFRSRRTTPKPMVQGPQTATVVGPAGEEIHVDEYGRIKVRFHWDRHSKDHEVSSCWVRVSQPWAGKNFGMVAWPRIDQEVVVEFLEGDPDRPLVTGRVYNQANMPPYGLPANKTQSGILTRSTLGASAANANWLRFEDKKGGEQVFLHAEKNQDIEVENDETHWVGHDRKKTIDNDETTHVKHDRTETVDNNETITIHANRTEVVDKEETITIHGGRTEVVDKEENITVHGGRTEKVDKDESITIDGGRTETVAKNEGITINGGRTETVAKDESITINGGRTETVAKDESITINGGRTETVAKDESITINGGRTETVAKDEGITINGGRTESVAKDEGVTITGARTVDIGKADSLTVGKTLTVTATDAISFTTGDASITMKKDGTITIKGKDITIHGSGKISVKADSDVVIKGSKVLQN